MLVLRLLAVLSLATATAAAGPPAAGPVQPFAAGIVGPEGLAFDRDGGLLVGQANGDVVRLGPDGTAQPYASIGEPLAGLTVLRDGRLLVATFASDVVWSVPRGGGAATVFASVATDPNFVVQTRRGNIFASASGSGSIVEISGPTPVVVASGLAFPNGLAIGPDRFLYVAELTAARISRLPIFRDGSLGAAEVYATGTTVADGLAFDRRGDLLVAGFDQVLVIDRATRTTTPLSTDPLLEWPSNLAFGRGRGFNRRDVFLANFGLPLGSGTTVVRMPYNQGGAKLVR
jgi:sugar lactone lactonase YvrE